MTARVPASVLITWLFAVAALPAATASANMASPNASGDPVGEPGGALADMHVEHERLSIDLRPLEQGDPALVEATYRIRNDGSERAVDLVFVAAGLQSADGGVWLDGQPVDSRVGGSAATLPWSAPKTTPGLDGRPLPYLAIVDRFDDYLEFSPTIATGHNEITVRYAAQAGAYSGGSPARYWQFGYVLAPAREWPSFGTLDVAVQLPPGWAAASEPALERMGDELRGSFDGVPADSLAITTQAPVPATLGFIFLAAIVVVIAIGFVIARAGGRFLRARRRRTLWLLPITLLYSIVATIVIVLVGDGTLGGGYIPSAQRAWGYGAGLVLIIASPLIIVGLTIVLQLIAWRAARRASPQAA